MMEEKDEYKRGYIDGQSNGYEFTEKFAIEEYERGLNDAWECAKKISLSVVDGGLSANEIEDIFGCSFYYVPKAYTPLEAIAKIKEYKKRKQENDEIKIGDEVMYDSKQYIITAIANGGHTLMLLGLGGGYMIRAIPKAITKTGRHFPQIAEVLKLMYENDSLEVRNDGNNARDEHT